jgi:hypothetical protein
LIFIAYSPPLMVLTSSDTLIDQPKKDKKSMPAPTIIKK